MAQRILVVEDELEIVRVVRAYLERSGYEVIVARDGREGLRRAQQESPNLVVLDLNLPVVDGLDVCRALRRESDLPIIMVTARAEEADKLIGLELGADDYVTKPFSPRELVARVRAVLRRVHSEELPTDVIHAGDIEIDVTGHKVTVRGHTVALTPTEFELLATMARHPGRVFTREQLLEATTGEAYEGYERTINVHIKNLRQKIEPDPSDPLYVRTVRGLGYKYEEQG